MEAQYFPCRFCGGERVLNPHTGKVFCKNKCWLEKDFKTTHEMRDENKEFKVEDEAEKILAALKNLEEITKEGFRILNENIKAIAHL